MSVRVIDSSRLMSERVWIRPPIGKATLRDTLETFVRFRSLMRSPDTCADPMLVQLQDTVSRLISRVLAGDDPRTVFAVDRKPRGRKRNEWREFAAVCEVARLRAAGCDDAVARVANVFNSGNVRTLERWMQHWDFRQVNVDEYVELLKGAGLL